MFLKQATASQSRLIGPFVSDSDFKTVQTGLTIANTDIKLSANGAAGASKNSGGGTHRNNGMYGVTFDATDTATVGELSGSVVVSGALPVAFKFFVVEEVVYDAWYAASAVGYITDQPVNVTKVNGTGQTARDLGQGIPNAVPGAAGGLLIAGVNAPLTIQGSGDALTIASTGANGRGVVLSSNGSGAALETAGGTTGQGFKLRGGATSGIALDVQSNGGSHGAQMVALAANGSGLNLLGAGLGHGLGTTGGATGDGIRAVAGGSGSSVDIRGNITGDLHGDLVGSLLPGERTSIADALLDRNMASGTDSGSPTVRTVRQALRFNRNKWTIVAGTLTVYKEDDSTVSWTAVATQTAGNPVSSVDPA